MSADATEATANIVVELPAAKTADDIRTLAPRMPFWDVLAKDIKSTLDQAEKSQTRADDLRLTAGRMLLAAKEKIKAYRDRFDGVEKCPTWKAWREKHFAKSDRDIRRCIALVKSPDPEAAREEEKEAGRASMAKSRVEKRTNVCPPSAPAPTPATAPASAPTLAVEKTDKDWDQRVQAAEAKKAAKKTPPEDAALPTAAPASGPPPAPAAAPSGEPGADDATMRYLRLKAAWNTARPGERQKLLNRLEISGHRAELIAEREIVP